MIDPNLPGCGACLRICALCKRISQRQRSSIYFGKHRWSPQTWLITDADAMAILGCTQKELNRLIRYNKIAIDKTRKTYRIAFYDVARLRQGATVKGISVKEERVGIVTAIDRLIAMRQEQAEILDAWLAEWSIGHTERTFRYGRQVEQAAPPSGLYYVYHVCHPTGRPLYVGKGIGSRMYQHEKEARRGVVSYKCNVIRKILGEGKQLWYKVVFITPDESEAYVYETLEIARIGHKKLTNIAAGGASPKEMGRVLNLHVSPEQLNYKQYVERLTTRGVPSKEQKSHLRPWAWMRVCMLEWLYEQAVQITHEYARQMIKAEIESLTPLFAHQKSFADLEPYQRRYSEWRINRTD